jgi:hypothetical protein
MHELRDSNDMSYSSLAHNVITQIHMALSILVASIPAYRPFMKRATSGMMSIRLGQGFGTYGVSADYPMDNLSRTSNHTKKRTQASAQASKFIRRTVEVAVDTRRAPDERHLNPCQDDKIWDANSSTWTKGS